MLVNTTAAPSTSSDTSGGHAYAALVKREEHHRELTSRIQLADRRGLALHRRDEPLIADRTEHDDDVAADDDERETRAE